MIDVIIADHQELFRIWDSGNTSSRRRRSYHRPATVLRTVAEHIERCQPSRIDPVDQFLAGVFENPGHVETPRDCIAGARRGERPRRLCALVASTRGRLSFDGWARSCGCDAPSGTR